MVLMLPGQGHRRVSLMHTPQCINWNNHRVLAHPLKENTEYLVLMKYVLK